MSDDFSVTRGQLTQWAESLLHITHHNAQIQRDLKAGDVDGAVDHAEKARIRAWRILNELFECGAERPEGYRESGTSPGSSLSETESVANGES